ncbi:Phasin protein [Tsuneonella dongtanensis]|uniref:Phasin protein n=1 Tax=Tsuneonella dongtanensis TaxID=692370 RepID=A0A1B2ACA4_9SPHN|nr:phasin family protein [Tsuneonella dongtanensis]ANY19731.1 Phasin protein [Tsuneonella dongtanensis]
MATQPETKIDTAKADAAAEKAYAAAAGDVTVNKASVAETAKVEAPKVDTPKIDKAVAEVKAAPAKKAVAKKAPAKKAVAKKAAPKKVAKKAVAAKAAPKKTALKAKPAAKPAAKKVAKTAKTPVSTVSNLKDKIMATAKKTADADYAAKAKEFAADAQTRAKAAYDKLQAVAGEMTEFTKGNVEALVESGKILGTGVQDMARGELAVAKGAFETATADLKAMAAVKSPTELFKLQGEIARRNFDAAVAHYSKNAETGMKIANEAFAPLSSRVSLAVEKFSKAA